MCGRWRLQSAAWILFVLVHAVVVSGAVAKVVPVPTDLPALCLRLCGLLGRLRRRSWTYCNVWLTISQWAARKPAALLVFLLEADGELGHWESGLYPMDEWTCTLLMLFACPTVVPVLADLGL